MEMRMIRHINKLGICFSHILFLSLSLIPISRATSIVTEDEQVVYLANIIVCRFKVKTIVETEKDGTWRVSQAENEYRYDINFLIIVTYVCPEFVEEWRDYPQLRVHFHSPYSSNNVLDEQVQINSSWFLTEGQTKPLLLIISARAPAEWKSYFESRRIRLEPYFEYSIYQYTSSWEDVHLLSAYWRGEPIYIDITQISEDALTQISSLRTELNTMRNLVYVLTLTTVILIATTIYFAKRKSR